MTQAGKDIYSHHDPQAPDPYDLESPISTKNPEFPVEHADKEKRKGRVIGNLELPSRADLWDAVLGVPNTANALEHVQTYIEFVEKHIVTMWDEAIAPTKSRIRFYDLPMIFRPGDLVFTPKVSDKSVDKNKSGAMQVRQEIFKLHWAEPANIIADNGPIDWRVTGMEMRAHIYHVDFNGST